MRDVEIPAVPGRRQLASPQDPQALAAIALLVSLMVLAMGLLALGSITPTASAEPYCDGPDPTPICAGDPEEAEMIRLSATSHYGTVSTYEGESARREAQSGSSFHLSGTFTGVSPARSARVRVTETWWCNYGASVRTFTTTAVGTHTVANPELGCPNDGLYEHIVTAVAFDPNSALSTGELTIKTFGPSFTRTGCRPSAPGERAEPHQADPPSDHTRREGRYPPER